MSVRIFGHHVSVPVVLLMLAEAASHLGAVYLAATRGFLDINFQLFSATNEPIWMLPRAIVYATVMFGVMVAFGLYGSVLYRETREYKVRFFASFPAGALLIMIIFYVVPRIILGRSILAMSLAFSLILTMVARAAFFKVVGQEALKRRVIVLGSGSRAAEVGALVSQLGNGAGFHLVGFVCCGDEQPGADPSKLLRGDCTSLRPLIDQYRVDEIVVGVRDRRNGYLSMEILLECRLAGVSVVDLPTFFERETGCVQLNSLSPSWMVYSEGFSRSGAQKVLKRLFDVGVGGTMLVAALPVMLIAALAIWVESGRPILYRQKRIGESGRAFEILKFRSMSIDAERDGIARWLQQNDRRVTRVGKFLRKTRLDELPQLINVLRGEMSFVGPRPERPPFVTELNGKVPYYASRHSVKPGITGWAQVRYPYGASVDDAVHKLQFDLYYVKNHSLFLDLLILFQTAHVVLFGQGAR